MEIVRQIVECSALANVIPLPTSFQNGKVEIIVLPIVEKPSPPKYSGKKLDEMLEGSITQSLIGAIPISKFSLEEIREERLRKMKVLIDTNITPACKKINSVNAS